MPIQINNVSRRAVYAPTGVGGAGPYSFTFEILAAGDIAVYKDDVLLTLTTHYTVSIASNGTGTVTITSAGLALAPASPTQYAIVGNRTIARTTDYTVSSQNVVFTTAPASGVQIQIRYLAGGGSTSYPLFQNALTAAKTYGRGGKGIPIFASSGNQSKGTYAVLFC